MQTIKVVLVLVFSVLSFTSFAKSEFSYDYIDTSIWRQEASLNGIHLERYDGYLVSVSKALTENIHLLGSYMDSENSNGDALDNKAMGFGVNYPINKNTDIVIDYTHLKYYFSYVNQTNIGGRFNSIDANILHQFSDDIELSAGLIRNNKAGGVIVYKGYNVGAKYRINSNLSLRFKIQGLKDSKSPNSVDVDAKELGIRYYF